MAMVQLNKLERKKMLDFYMICKTFHNNGIHTETAALEGKAKLLKNAKIQTLAVAIIAALSALIFSQSAAVIALFTVIIMLYIWGFTYRGRNYVQRYIDEILKHPDYNPETGLVEPIEEPDVTADATTDNK
ncbi:MAG: hypothetical protein ACRBHB_14120 [Arenicella sp.]